MGANDVAYGGDDSDTVSFVGGPIYLDMNAAFSFIGGDTIYLREFETYIGTGGGDTVYGASYGETISLGDGDDFLYGQGGDDFLYISPGADVMDGGDDYDTMVFHKAMVADWQSGLLDADISSDPWANWEAIQGSAGDDRIRTNSWGYSVELRGGGGNDVLATGVVGVVSDILKGEAGNDNLSGGAGDDTLDGGTDNDTADYSSSAAGVNVSLALSGPQNTGGAGTDTLIGIENLRGSSAGDTLTGDGLTNYLDGGLGGDVLNGGGGTDFADYANAATGVSVNLTSPGTNTGEAAGDSYALIEGARGGNFNDTLTGNGGPNTLYGLAGNDSLLGGIGNDRLYGGVGNDTTTGGLGDDTHVVTEFGDVVTDYAGAGTDTVEAWIFHQLGNNIENLALKGVALTGYGNTLNNTLIGNASNNRLQGNGGADTMAGGLGNDTYVVTEFTDVVVEAAGAGTDTVESWIFHQLGANVENLILKGVALTGQGNGLNNTLTGNASNNRLEGAGGSDTMAGGLGNDTYVVTEFGDVVVEAAAAGTDTVESWIFHQLGANVDNLVLKGVALTGYGNGLNNTLTGNASANLFDGGLGNDTMAGGTGADSFQFSTALAGNVDRVTDFAPVDDTIRLENAVFTALTATGTLAASSFRIGTAAADANDFVIYNATTGALLYDADGSGATGAVQFATLNAGLALTNADFFVV